RQTVRLRFDLAPDHVRYALAELRATLKRNNRVEDSSSRVRLLRFVDTGMDVEIYAYILVRDYADFLALQEDLLLNIADTLERPVCGLSLPAQTELLARDAGIDREKEKAAKAAMENARKSGQAGGQMPAP